MTTCILLSSHGFSTTADDGSSYSSNFQPIYSSSDLQHQIGTLEVATAVKVLENAPDADKIELILWKNSADSNDVLYEKLGLNILSTTFTDKDFIQNTDNFSILETTEDPATKSEWQKVKANVWVKKGSLSNSNDAAWNQAKVAYEFNCGACHDLPEETLTDANTWPEVFEGMVDSTEMNDAEQKLVLKYLQLHSSDFKK